MKITCLLALHPSAQVERRRDSRPRRPPLVVSPQGPPTVRGPAFLAVEAISVLARRVVKLEPKGADL